MTDEKPKESSLKSPLDMFYRWESETPDRIFLRQAKQLHWTDYSWREVADQIRRVASYIRSKNFPEKSKIIICSSNSKDWIIVDLAIMLSGHVSVPIYPAQDFTSARYILEHSESVMAFIGAFSLAPQAAELFGERPLVGMLNCAVETETTIDHIIETCEPYNESPVADLDELFTITYTSGTSGNPKGAMHRYRAVAVSQPGLVQEFRQEVNSTPPARTLSYLPLSHIAERTVAEMLSLYSNATISFSEGLETFAEEIKSVQPTHFFSVPRLWTIFKQGVDAKIPPEVQAGFGEKEKAHLRHELGLAECKFIYTGSAPCPTEIQQWFQNMGIILRDGYGMTENFVHGCGWHKDDNPIPGCVGTAFPGAEVKLTDDNEICFRSDAIMLGYYKEPEKTAEVIKDGWYHTGDTGRFDEDGNLYITGRISEVFKTSKGKFIKPTPIEDKVGSWDELSQVCVRGHGLDQPVLLCNLAITARSQSPESLTEVLTEKLNAMNESLPAWERIGGVFITKDDWTIDNELLTPTMKLKRKALEEKYGEWSSRVNKDQLIYWEQ